MAVALNEVIHVASETFVKIEKELEQEMIDGNHHART
jgi:hypothetical protein